MKRQMPLAIVALLLTGCAAKVRYPPPVSAPLQRAIQWNTPAGERVTAKPADDQALSRWWEALNDPVLAGLEERAMKGNLDLREAVARIRQAKAQRAAASTELQPSINAGATAGGSRANNRDGRGEVTQSYSASLEASWEPDFFSKIRGGIDAYDADIGAAEESLRDVMVSLTAEVALNYIDVRNYQSQLEITRANLVAQEETYELTKAQFESGLVSKLDEEQARQLVESTRSSVPALETSIQQAANGIAVLLGERPGALDGELAAVTPLPAIPDEIAVGVPADLVRRRPDIRYSERQVAAQTARLGVAKANLNPAFALSGALNLRASGIQNLFTPASLASSAAGSISQTVFNRGKLREQINVQDALLEQYVASYESTVLTALQDVENAMIAFENEQARRRSLAEANVASEQALSMARELYGAGLKDFLTVLDAQRSQLSLQNQLAQCDATITANLVRLYKSLGGGWI